MQQHSRSILCLYLFTALLVSLAGSAVQVTPVYAAGIVVNSTADTLADDGQCTLREAIIAAEMGLRSGLKAGECVAGSGVDTITFDGNYTITLSGSQLPEITTTVTILGSGADNTIIQAAVMPQIAGYRVFEVGSNGNLTLEQVTVRNGDCSGGIKCGPQDPYLPYKYYGGGIRNAGTLTLMNSNLSDNRSLGDGGGIYNSGGTVYVRNSKIINNTANHGGGVYSNNGTLTMEDSTFSGNISATDGGGIENWGSTTNIQSSIFLNNQASGDGGGIYNGLNMTLTNSTFSGNSAKYGGGIYHRNISKLTVTNSTFSGNSSTSGGGICASAYDGKITVQNSILANNPNGGNCVGAITNGGNNLDSGTTCGWGMVNGSMSNTDPELLPLADNGGPTQTFAIPASSPARNTGNDSNCPAADQRGISRKDRGAHCDIGAYEIAIPLTPTFVDVPTDYLYFEDVEILYANGLTGGCSLSPLKFCPGTLMTRADAAVFMMRAVQGSSYIPHPTANRFQDNWSLGPWARPWAEAMYETGLTTGCSSNPLKYCPWGKLPRGQLVIFGLKMKHGSDYLPPPATGTVFADMTDPNYYATAWAEQAYREGLIEKCGTDPVTLKPLFCPDKINAPRGLAAYVIVRAKSLTMP